MLWCKSVQGLGKLYCPQDYKNEFPIVLLVQWHLWESDAPAPPLVLFSNRSKAKGKGKQANTHNGPLIHSNATFDNFIAVQNPLQLFKIHLDTISVTAIAQILHGHCEGYCCVIFQTAVL